MLNKPVLVPATTPTSVGSAIFAGLAAGIFPSVAEGQDALCPEHRVFTPHPAHAARYERLYQLYRTLYFGFGQRGSEAVAIGDILPSLREIAAEVRQQNRTAANRTLA